jgi:hypothetical protein
MAEGQEFVRQKCAYVAKLGPKYIGPFTISRKVGYCTYELEDDSGTKKGHWHVQDVKPVNEPYDPG